MKFLYSPDPEKNSVIQKDLDLLINFITSRLKNISSLMLIGGFAHQEGAVIWYNDQWLPINDYDLYIISEQDTKSAIIERVFDECNRLLRKSRKPYQKLPEAIVTPFDFQKDFFVDGHFLRVQDLSSLPPTIRYWEMKKNGLVLHGNDVRGLIKDFSQDEIPLSEGFRYLNNCLTTLIRLWGANHKESIWYFGNRIWCYFCVSLLLLKRQLEPSYAGRAKKIKEIYAKEFPELYRELPDLAEQIEQSTQVKLDPPSKVELSEEDLNQFLAKTKDAGLKLLDFYLKNWMANDNFSAFYFQPYIEKNLPYGKKLFPIYNWLCQFFLNLKYSWQIWKKEKRIFVPKDLFIAVDIKLWQLMPEVLKNLDNQESESAKKIEQQIPYFSALPKKMKAPPCYLPDCEKNYKNLDFRQKYLLTFYYAEKTRDIHREISLTRRLVNFFR